jgi:outer membrane protein TolC
MVASAGLVGVGSDVGGALSALVGVSDYQVSAGLSFSWGIGSAAGAAEKSSRIQRATAKRSAKDAERDVVAAVVLAYREIRASQKRIDVASRAIELARENFATEQALFRADKSSNVQVFERQAELEEAQLLEVRAAIGYRIAIATVDYLTGDILKRYDVEVVARPDRKAE